MPKNSSKTYVSNQFHFNDFNQKNCNGSSKSDIMEPSMKSGENNSLVVIERDFVSSSDILEDKCGKVVENVIEACKKVPYSYVGGAVKSYHLSFDEDKQ